MLTTRWYLLALLIPLLLLVAGAIPALTSLALVYALGLLIITVLDRASAGKAAQFTVRRGHDQKLSLGALNPVTLNIASRSPRTQTMTVQDDAPLGFITADGQRQQVSVEPLGNASYSYQVRPLQRGDFAFGDIYLRWQGPLGLFTRQAKVNAAETVKVYPNIYAIRQYDLLLHRDQLSEMGLRNIRVPQQGTMFESLRDYTPDDPYRSINWKATARRGKPISADYEPERNQRIMIVLDVGRMMRSVIRVEDGADVWNMAKLDFVINAMLLLAYVATQKGDQVGLLVFADQVKQFLAPAAGNAQFQRLLEAMYALKSEPIEADYGRAVSFLRAQQKKRALTVMFTDLSGARASESMLAHLPRLTPQHLPLLVTIRDPALDSEAAQVPSYSDAVYRRAVAEQLIDERRLLLDRLRRRGVLTLDTNARQLSINVVSRYLELKGRALI